MTKNYILIVEDEWIIYDQLASFLTKKEFEIAPYTKSYQEAINQIRLRIPDMVLLDIHLQGEKDGIDLGELLFKKYCIPFLYLSAYSDEVTLNRARRTSPNTFLIKTKPDIDKEQLYVSIKMALSKIKASLPENQTGLFVNTGYCRNVSDVGWDELKKVLFKFENILWIEIDNEKSNYLIFKTTNAKGYLRNSLKKINEILPFYFVRINPQQIVNLKKVEGKINNSSFKILDETFEISSKYSDRVHKVLHSFYYE